MKLKWKFLCWVTWFILPIFGTTIVFGQIQPAEIFSIEQNSNFYHLRYRSALNRGKTDLLFSQPSGAHSLKAAISENAVELVDEFLAQTGNLNSRLYPSSAKRSELRNFSNNNEIKENQAFNHIPFYRYLRNAASLKAAFIFLISGLFATSLFTIGGFVVWNHLMSGAYMAAIYTSLIMVLLSGTIFSVSEVVLMQLLLPFTKDEGPTLRPPAVNDENLPTATIQIPVRNEPVDVVQRTLESAMTSIMRRGN